MQITRQADYAVRAVVHLAQLGRGAKLATARLAIEQSISPTFLAKIVAQLVAAGIVRTLRGAQGGVLLARPAEDINLLEVVEAIDGPLTLNECVRNPQACPISGDCAVREVWCEAQASLAARLRQTTFGQLVQPKPSQLLNLELGGYDQSTEMRRGNLERGCALAPA